MAGTEPDVSGANIDWMHIGEPGADPVNDAYYSNPANTQSMSVEDAIAQLKQQYENKYASGSAGTSNPEQLGKAKTANISVEDFNTVTKDVPGSLDDKLKAYKGFLEQGTQPGWTTEGDHAGDLIAKYIPYAIAAMSLYGGITAGLAGVANAGAGGAAGAAGGTVGGAVDAGAAAGETAAGAAAASSIPEVLVSGTAPTLGAGAAAAGSAIGAGAGAAAAGAGNTGAQAPTSDSNIPEVTVQGTRPTLGGALPGASVGAGIAGGIGAQIANGTLQAQPPSSSTSQGDDISNEDLTKGTKVDVPSTFNIGNTGGESSGIGGWLTKANDFLKTPIGQGIANVAGSVISGIGSSKEKQAELDQQKELATRYDNAWRDPGQLAQLKASVLDSPTVSTGYLDRARRVSDFLNSRQVPSLSPGDPNKVYGSYVTGK